MTIRPATVALLLALSGCNGIDTGLNPQHEMGNEQEPMPRRRRLWWGDGELSGVELMSGDGMG